MSNIVELDNETVLEFIISDDDGIVDITNVTNILFRMKKSFLNTIEKTCTVTDAKNGKCEVTLSSSDTDTSGRFAYQLTVTFFDGSGFSTEQNILQIDKKL